MKNVSARIGIFLISLVSLPAVAQSTITIYLDGKYIVSTETRQIEVKDTVCNQHKGTFSLKGNGRIAITVCQNASGYGRVEYRNVTNNGPWTGSSFLKDGDSVSP